MFQISVLFVRRQRSWILSDSRGRRMRKIFTNSSLEKPCLHLSDVWDLFSTSNSYRTFALVSFQSMQVR